MDRYWRDGRWHYSQSAEPELDFGPELIDWLDEVRKDWRAGIPALFASLRLALMGALGALQGGSGWGTLLTIRAALMIGLWRVFLAAAVISYALIMSAVIDSLLGLGIYPR